MTAWLYAIARRVASNARRSELRRNRRREALAHTQALRPTQPAPERGAAVVVVERFLQQLPPQHREAFALSELDGLTGPEIARCLGWNLATTYGRIRELRLRFAAHCDDPAATLAAQRKHRPQPTHAAIAAFVDRATAALTAPVAAAPSTLASVATSIGLAGAVLVGVHGVAEAVDPPPTTTAQTAAPTIDRPPNLHDAQPAPPVHAVASVVTTVAPRPQPLPARLEHPRPVRRHAERPKAPRPPAATETGQQPQSALASAAIAVRQGRAGDALALVDEHARQVPDSPLSDVRAALRIEALCELGQAQAAERDAASFIVDYPTSPALVRVRAGCRR